MTHTEKQVALLLKSSICGENAIDFSKMTTEESLSILEEADNQSVTSVCFHELPKSVTNKLTEYRKIVLKITAANIQVEYAHVALNNLLKENGIAYCFIKGCASSYYYNSPTFRKMGDVDILVKPEDLDRTALLLEKSGYYRNRYVPKSRLHINFEKDLIHIELHTAVSYLAERDVDITAFTYGIIDTARQGTLSQGTVLMPSPLYHGVIMLLHMYRHFTGAGFGLRHLYDWAAFINHKDYDIVADELAEKARELGLYKFMQTACCTCVMYLGVNKKQSFGNIDKSLCDEFFEFIISSGNFGVKKSNSISKMFVERSLSNADSNYLHSYGASVREKVYQRYPKAGESKGEYAKAVIDLYTKYFLKILTGKKPFPNIGKDCKQAEEIKKLFKNLSD